MDSIREIQMAKTKLCDTGHMDDNRRKAFDEAINDMRFVKWFHKKYKKQFEDLVDEMHMNR